MTSNIEQQRINKKRIITVALTVTLAGSLAIPPCRADIIGSLGSVANFLGSNGLFGNILSQLTQIFPELSSITQWTSLLTKTINDPCSATPILLANPAAPGWCTSAVGVIKGNGSITGVLQSVRGAIGLPDPLQARQSITFDVNSAALANANFSPDVFVTSPTVFGQDLANTSDRISTFLNAETYLSSDGQTQIQNQINVSNQSLQNIASTSDAAQSATSTQDVVKAIAREIAQQAILTNMAQSSAIASRTDTQFTNLNLSNISNSIDQQNRLKQAEATTNSYDLLYLSGQAKLF